MIVKASKGQVMRVEKRSICELMAEEPRYRYPTKDTTCQQTISIPSSGGIGVTPQDQRAITLHPAHLCHQSHDNQTKLSPKEAYKPPETAAQQTAQLFSSYKWTYVLPRSTV
ncbi:hypothetical protein DL546_008742 [Coniochaeta pulveracea]|uniref:Uncharacterized protein n=1 Tax=Coniochaeta pulveracea TaxID=177199 RepID=A0A420YMZ7_9PEZI|nr:hypothetical protein DL546_008742 [Coniochaeta pulveracea]